MAMAMSGAGASAETVVLQQGLDGYSGCVATTFQGVPGAGPDPAAGAHLLLRGAQNQVAIKFELPPELVERKLARARLEVFVPSVRNLRMICEIRCHPVEEAWEQLAGSLVPHALAGGWLNGSTDYGRGRPPGVVDSYELWEYDGQWFPHRYASLGVPPEGKWVDFNITPLVGKWLADPASNHGIALVPVNLPDHRFPNTAALDIPSPAHSDHSKRPRLVLEFAALNMPYLVGMTHTLEKYSDLSTRHRYFGPFLEHYEMEMARNEFEGFQVLVYPMGGRLEGVTFEWADLLDEATGACIPSADLTYHRVEVFPRLHENGKIRDWYFHGRNFAVPDPLVAARPADLSEHLSTPFWFTVRTRPQTRAGRYRGTITVRPRNAPPRDLKLTVRVWDYVIPEQWDFQAMGQMVWDYVRRVHGEITPELRRRYIDFLMDHRFNPTEQYVDKLSPPLEDLEYVTGRGGNTIYLSGNFTGQVDSLKERYEAVRKLGLVDKALVYIGDETSEWAEMRRRSEAIRKGCPELMIMIGGSFPRPELDGVIDIFDPQIDAGSNEIYSLPADRMKPLVAQAQSRGEKFVWYVAAGPMLPCPNVQMEEPLIVSRLLFWLTWKFGVTGFEYYCYNIWEHNLPKEGKRWPEISFYPRGWGDTNGDGMLFYPGPDGPFSSVRFENIRDGIEDWESHSVLRDYVQALRARALRDRALATQGGPLLEKAEALLAVPDEVCRDFVNWTWEPEVLLKARHELGETIDQIAKLVPESEMLAARATRRQAEVARQREMLNQRAKAAR